jgi:hypothetical protein
MPGFNQKGPMGDGPMTGRRLGRCTNYGAKLKPAASEATIHPVTDAPVRSEEMDNMPGRGMGWGRGRGRGMMGRGSGRGLGRGSGRQNRFRSGQ